MGHINRKWGLHLWNISIEEKKKIYETYQQKMEIKFMGHNRRCGLNLWDISIEERN